MIESEVFVFGSNRQGIHKAGAARDAYVLHGAKMFQGEGFAGNSYAIPTRYFAGLRGGGLVSLPLDEIEKHVKKFLHFAEAHASLRFQVTALGTGRAGYKHEQIAPMFKGAPSNCSFPKEWETYL